MKKIYIAKVINPWMADELHEFSKHTTFELILFRKPSIHYEQKIEQLINNGIKVSISPFKKNIYLHRIPFVFSFIIRNYSKFIGIKNLVFGIKSIGWFLRLDSKYFQKDLNIHAQFATQAAIVAFLIKKYYDPNIKYSFTIHAHDIFYKNRWLSELVYNSENTFSISNFNINYLKDVYKIKKDIVKLCRLGVESQEKNQYKKRKKEKYIIGFLSWFDKKKGIIYMLEAINFLTQERKDFMVYIAGEGELKEYIHNYISDNNLDTIQFLGPIYSEDKNNFYRSIDIFLLPSIKTKNDMDGIPLVLMEAISFSVPIISTNISGIPEICIDQYNGILIPQKDSKAISNALLDVIQNRSKLKRFSLNAFKISKKYELNKNSIKKLKKLQWII